MSIVFMAIRKYHYKYPHKPLLSCPVIVTLLAFGGGLLPNDERSSQGIRLRRELEGVEKLTTRVCL